jgi:hypothetical protein
LLACSEPERVDKVAVEVVRKEQCEEEGVGGEGDALPLRGGGIECQPANGNGKGPEFLGDPCNFSWNHEAPSAGGVASIAARW